MKYLLSILFLFLSFIPTYALPTTLEYPQFVKEWNAFLAKNKGNAKLTLSQEFKLIEEFGKEQFHRQRPGIKHTDRSQKWTPFNENKITLKDGTEMSASYLTFNWEEGNHFHDLISSQAPFSHNIHHFWQMIWEQEIDQVVMLTELVDIVPDRDLCHTYWPCGKEALKLKNGMTVTLIEEKWLLEKEKENIQIRKFNVQKKGVSRVITHYWYHNWIDHTVPTQSVTIKTVIKQVMNDNSHSKSAAPILVHCAGGIGRSGIFIACYHLSERKAFKAKPVKFFDFVAQLRWQRVKLVSRNAAYKFCLEHHKGK